MDTLAIVSLICLIAAIALGFFFKVNIGIIAVGAALVLGKLSGIEDGTILKYFNSTLFMRLLGVLLLFSIAQANGTIEKLTRRAVYSMRKIPRLIPILIFIISALLGGVAGSIPILALMATITAALARQMNVHPIKLAPFEVFGAIAGAVTPVSMSGVLIESLAVDAGLPFSYLPSYLTSVLCNFVPCLACFFLFRWHTHKSIPGFEAMKPEKLDRPQLITPFGIILMIAMTVFFGIDVGLASIFCSVLLLFLRVSDEKASLNGVPWGTLVMISGMGILISTSSPTGNIIFSAWASFGFSGRPESPTGWSSAALNPDGLANMAPATIAVDFKNVFLSIVEFLLCCDLSVNYKRKLQA